MSSEDHSGGGVFGCGTWLLLAALGASAGLMAPSPDWSRIFSELTQGAVQALEDGAVRASPGTPSPQLVSVSDPGDSEASRNPEVGRATEGARRVPSVARGKDFRRLTPEVLMAAPGGGALEFGCPGCGREHRFSKPRQGGPMWFWLECPARQTPVLAFEFLEDGTCRELPVQTKPSRKLIREGGCFHLTCQSCGQSRWELLPARRSSQLVLCSNASCRRLLLYLEVDENGIRRAMPDYFEGFSPDPAETNLVAVWLLHLARFQYDHAKARSGDPIWQTSLGTWRTQTGVCRDSATLLADWMRAAGHDARIVIGRVVGNRWPAGDGGGHAWVVVVENGAGRQYLLETTTETEESRRRTPPLAILKAMEYFPEYQFLPDGYRGMESSPSRGGEYERGWYQTPHSMDP